MKHSIYIIILLLFVSSCTTPKARKPISRKTSTFIEKSIKRNKAINKMEENFFKEMMNRDTINTYLSSSNGFWYYYNNKIDADIKTPIKGNEVVINYEIRDVQNNIIYTKNELGSKDQPVEGDRTYKIDSEDFITGIQEGIKLMKEGETITFLFPSNKVFGVSGFQDRIATNQPLIIEVYLKSIK